MKRFYEIAQDAPFMTAFAFVNATLLLYMLTGGQGDFWSGDMCGCIQTIVIVKLLTGPRQFTDKDGIIHF